MLNNRKCPYFKINDDTIRFFFTSQYLAQFVEVVSNFLIIALNAYKLIINKSINFTILFHEIEGKKRVSLYIVWNFWFFLTEINANNQNFYFYYSQADQIGLY